MNTYHTREAYQKSGSTQYMFNPVHECQYWESLSLSTPQIYTRHICLIVKYVLYWSLCYFHLTVIRHIITKYIKLTTTAGNELFDMPESPVTLWLLWSLMIKPLPVLTWTQCKGHQLFSVVMTFPCLAAWEVLMAYRRDFQLLNIAFKTCWKVVTCTLESPF